MLQVSGQEASVAFSVLQFCDGGFLPSEGTIHWHKHVGGTLSCGGNKRGSRYRRVTAAAW